MRQLVDFMLFGLGALRIRFTAILDDGVVQKPEASRRRQYATAVVSKPVGEFLNGHGRLQHQLLGLAKARRARGVRVEHHDQGGRRRMFEHNIVTDSDQHGVILAFSENHLIRGSAFEGL